MCFPYGASGDLAANACSEPFGSKERVGANVKPHRVIVLSATAVMLTASLWTSLGRAADPGWVDCTGSYGGGWYCDSYVTVTCPSSGELEFGATCHSGDSAEFGYTIEQTFTETWIAASSIPSGAYIWLYADSGGSSSLACGNASGYTGCLGADGYTGYYYASVDSNGDENQGDIEDWVTNMTTPPDGE